MKRRDFLKGSLALALSVYFTGDWRRAKAGNMDYHRIVVISDSHLPVREQIHDESIHAQIIDGKYQVMRHINSWDDVESVAVTGDISARWSLDYEMEYTKQFFSQCKHPLHIMAGNHDYIYSGGDEAGKNVWADAEGRAHKLSVFKAFWNLDNISYHEKVGNYRLFYLSPDSMNTDFSVGMSKEQLSWLDKELEKYSKEPAIIFFHAPLRGTHRQYNKKVNYGKSIAQPYAEIDKVVMAHPNVFMWVDGHTHTPATNPSYADKKVNLYKNKIMSIHTGTMDALNVYSNSLYLYDDRVEVRTYDHMKNEWMTAIDRVIYPPVL